MARKIIIGGLFANIDANVCNGLAFLNSDGSFDSAFSEGSGSPGIQYFYNSGIRDIGIQSDGKIVVVGDFTQARDQVRNGIARFNTDGSLDATFNASTVRGIGPIGSEYINKIYVENDDKLIISGVFDNYQGTAVDGGLIRLNSDGTLHTQFNITEDGLPFKRYADTFAVQSNGKVLASVSSDTSLQRFNSDGTVDNTFVSAISGTISDIKIQSNGKILVAGYLTPDSTNYSFIYRLNADGTLDNTFTIGATDYMDSPVIAIQSDGKIYIGGDVNPGNCFYRLNSDGSLDTTWDDYATPDFTSDPLVDPFFDYSRIYKIDVLDDGDIIVAGRFTDYKGNNTNKIITLNNNNTVDSAWNINAAFADNAITSFAYFDTEPEPDTSTSVYSNAYYDFTSTARGIDLYGIYTSAVQIKIENTSNVNFTLTKETIVDLDNIISQSDINTVAIKVKDVSANIESVSELDRIEINKFDGIQYDGIAELNVVLTATAGTTWSVTSESNVEVAPIEILRAIILVNSTSNINTDARKLDTVTVNIETTTSLTIYADDFDGVRAFATIASAAGLIVSDPLRLSENLFEDQSLIRTLISFNGRPITAQSRSYGENIEFLMVEGQNWKGRKNRYYKKKSTRKTINVSWEFIPGQRGETVDLKESRDYISSLAKKKSTIVVDIYNLDTNGLEAPTTEQAEFFISSYNEEITRRDIANNIYFWKCSMTLVEA